MRKCLIVLALAALSTACAKCGRCRGVAQPVSYTAEEVLAYCRAGWESRQLTDGTVEYNPCFY